MPALLLDRFQPVLILALIPPVQAVQAQAEISSKFSCSRQIAFTQQRRQVTGQILQPPAPGLNQHQAEAGVHPECGNALPISGDLSLGSEQTELPQLMQAFLEQCLGRRFQPLKFLSKTCSPLRQVQHGGLWIGPLEFRQILCRPAPVLGCRPQAHTAPRRLPSGPSSSLLCAGLTGRNGHQPFHS